MASSAVQIANAIKQDVGRIANKIARGVAEVAYQEMQDAHRSIMDDYYGGYSPVAYYHYEYTDPETGKHYSGESHGYRRTGNLRNSLSPQGVSSYGKHSFKATINVDSSGMSDYVGVTKKHRVFPGSSVFDMVWNDAIRGLPSGYRGSIGEFSINTSTAGVSMSGTPDNAMQDFVEQWGLIRGPEVADMIAGV